MKRILRASKRLLSILGVPLPKRKNKGLKRKLQNATKPRKPTAFKNLLRSRGYCVQEGIEFSGVLRLRRPTAFNEV